MNRLIPLLMASLVTPAFAGDLGLHDISSETLDCQTVFESKSWRGYVLGQGKAKLKFTPERILVTTDQGLKAKRIKDNRLDLKKFGESGITQSQVISFDVDKWSVPAAEDLNTQFTVFYIDSNGKKELAKFFFFGWKIQESRRFARTFLAWLNNDLESCTGLP